MGDLQRQLRFDEHKVATLKTSSPPQQVSAEQIYVLLFAGTTSPVSALPLLLDSLTPHNLHPHLPTLSLKSPTPALRSALRRYIVQTDALDVSIYFMYDLAN